MAIFSHLHFFLCCVAWWLEGVHASLRGDVVSRSFVQQKLQSELQALLGHDGSSDRLLRLEELIRPTFSAMPKRADGGIGQEQASYALQRFFMRQHGWVIQGLRVAKQGESAANSTDMLKSRMPAAVFELLEEQMNGRSIGIRELAVLAATVEDLVYGDVVECLARVFELVDGNDEELLLHGFLAFFVSPQQVRESVTDKEELMRYVDSAATTIFGWSELLLWAQDLKSSLAKQRPFHQPADDPQDFRAMAELAEAVTANFGRHQDLECKAVKNSLLDLEEEHRGDGRALLARFYDAYSSDNNRYFRESKDYLRSIGALDESVPMRPTVIVPNYVYADSNCVAASGFMSVCCISQCEPLMTAIEEKVAAPLASPADIVEVVQSASTETVAPRQLSSSLLERLDEIAAANRGRVPLHGRLFAQWLHHAFPNECPFPSEAVSDKGDVAVTADEEHMMEVIWEAYSVPEPLDEVPLELTAPWIQNETLPFEGADQDQEVARVNISAVLRCLAMGAVVLSSFVILMDKLRVMRRSYDGGVRCWFREMGGQLPSSAKSHVV